MDDRLFYCTGCARAYNSDKGICPICGDSHVEGAPDEYLRGIRMGKKHTADKIRKLFTTPDSFVTVTPQRLIDLLELER